MPASREAAVQTFSAVLPAQRREGYGQTYSAALPTLSREAVAQTFSAALPAQRREGYGQSYSNVPTPTKGKGSNLQTVVRSDLPRGYWRYEEGAASASFTDDMQAAVQSRTGALTDAAGGVTEPVSKALAAWAAGSYLTWPTQPVLSAPFTVEAMVLVESDQTQQGVWGSRGPSEYGSCLYLNNRALHLDIGNGAAWKANLVVPAASSGVQLLTWHHLAVVVTTTAVTVYVDGAQKGTAAYAVTAPVPLLLDANRLLRVGQIGSSFTGHNGAGLRIDEFAVYDKPLTPDRLLIRATAETIAAEAATLASVGWGVPI